MNASVLSSPQRRKLRQLAHHLSPVIIIGSQGVSSGVIEETKRALHDHELIKIRLPDGAREDRIAQGDNLADACDAQIVQRIGKALVLFKDNPEADPRLSNRQRPG